MPIVKDISAASFPSWKSASAPLLAFRDCRETTDNKVDSYQGYTTHPFFFLAWSTPEFVLPLNPLWHPSIATCHPLQQVSALKQGLWARFHICDKSQLDPGATCEMLQLKCAPTSMPATWGRERSSFTHHSSVTLMELLLKNGELAPMTQVM